MNTENKSTKLNNTDEKLHISDVRRSFSFTYDDLKEAFKNGGWVTSWCDYGYETRFESFEEWFDEWIKKNYV